ncbi:MAG: hypothetical protein Q9208_002476 [Pyrenodesmia sp. 3 TL-2023]
MDGDAQQAPKSVPRFASFRSNVLPTPTSKPSGSNKSDNLPLPTEYLKGSRDHARKLRKRRSPSLTPSHAEISFSKSKEHFVDLDEAPATFAIDVKGDYRNLEYGSSYGVPTYVRTEGRIALGAKTGPGSPAHRGATRDHANDSISKRIVKNLGRQKVHRVVADSTSTSENDAWAEFVHLRPSKRRKTELGDEAENEPRVYNLKDELNYSSKDAAEPPPPGGAVPEDWSGSDVEGMHSQAPVFEEHLRQRRAALSRQVEEDPTDWVSWLALVELQDEADGFFDVSSEGRRTNAERRSNAEVDLSIYEKALESVTDPEGRERLYLGMMFKAPRVWEPKRCASKWQKILKEHRSSHRLWKRYLDFHQSRLSDFSLEETRKHYLDLLQDVRKGQAPDQEARGSRPYSIQLYILLRLTLLLREGDYTELAVAIWQALLEFTFNKPHHLRSDPSQKMHDASLLAFEEFWESEVPRIGEPNAKGWLNYQNDGNEQAPPSAAMDSPSRPDSSAPKVWADAEREASSCLKMASRAIDASGEDPYRVALFSDIQPILSDLPTSSEQQAIVAAFLCFCHLPPHTNDEDNHIRSWYNDQFVRNEVLYDDISMSVTNDSTESSQSTPFAFPLAEHPISPDTLFPVAGKWFSAFGSCARNRGPVPEEFILATLKMLVNRGFGNESLAEYVLAFELQVSPTTVLKSAKGLLKKRPSSLPLYNAYALIQSRLGNGEMANTVFNTAIQMSNRLDHVASRDVILLWRNRIWEMLSSGQTTTALEQLLKFDNADAEGEASERGSATAYLRLRNALSAGRDEMLSLSLSSLAINYSELLVLLSYLTTSNSLPSALSSFASNLRLLAHTTTTTTSRPVTSSEVLFRQSLARLLYTHVLHKRPYSPRTTRAFLAESIAASPTNTIFLSLYAWNEARFRVDDRVRGIMRDVVLGSSHHHHSSTNPQQQEAEPMEAEDNIIPHHFAIHTDLHRGIAQGSNVQAVRGTFERALRSVPHSAGLWKWYFDFEHAKGDMKRARDVFYRAVRACPWVKELYMLAFEKLAGEEGEVMMGEGGLRGVRDMMVEREVRIRVGF